MNLFLKPIKTTIMAIGTREYQCENWNFYLLCSESHRCFGDSVEARDACSGKLQRGLKALELFWLANHTQKPTKKKYTKNMFTTYDARITNFTWIIGQQFCLESLHDESKVLIWMGFSLYTRFSNFVAL